MLYNFFEQENTQPPMKINYKKFISLTFSIIFLGLFMAPIAFAINCDQDGDQYIVIPNVVMREIAPDVPYTDNGDYSPVQWQDFFNIYKNAELTEEEKCEGLNFKKGAEPKRCDQIVVGANSEVYDPAVRTTPLRGSSVNPGALDVAGNSIDEDCDGRDASLLGDAGEGKELGGLVDKAITLLSRVVVVVSILVMIWGGVMYATAAGDEAKTSKARKAIIGAVIGLVVGLLAPTIVNWVAVNLV